MSKQFNDDTPWKMIGLDIANKQKRFPFKNSSHWKPDCIVKNISDLF